MKDLARKLLKLCKYHAALNASTPEPAEKMRAAPPCAHSHQKTLTLESTTLSPDLAAACLKSELPPRLALQTLAIAAVNPEFFIESRLSVLSESGYRTPLTQQQVVFLTFFHAPKDLPSAEPDQDLRELRIEMNREKVLADLTALAQVQSHLARHQFFISPIVLIDMRIAILNDNFTRMHHCVNALLLLDFDSYDAKLETLKTSLELPKKVHELESRLHERLNTGSDSAPASSCHIKMHNTLSTLLRITLDILEKDSDLMSAEQLSRNNQISELIEKMDKDSYKEAYSISDIKELNRLIVESTEELSAIDNTLQAILNEAASTLMELTAITHAPLLNQQLYTAKSDIELADTLQAELDTEAPSRARIPDEYHDGLPTPPIMS